MATPNSGITTIEYSLETDPTDQKPVIRTAIRTGTEQPSVTGDPVGTNTARRDMDILTARKSETEGGKVFLALHQLPADVAEQVLAFVEGSLAKNLREEQRAIELEAAVNANTEIITLCGKIRDLQRTRIRIPLDLDVEKFPNATLDFGEFENGSVELFLCFDSRVTNSCIQIIIKPNGQTNRLGMIRSGRDSFAAAALDEEARNMGNRLGTNEIINILETYLASLSA